MTSTGGVLELGTSSAMVRQCSRVCASVVTQLSTRCPTVCASDRGFVQADELAEARRATASGGSGSNPSGPTS